MRRILAFCVFIALAGWSLSQFRARGDAAWTPQGAGLESCSFSWRGAKVYAFRAAPTRVLLGTGATLDARDWLTKERARVAINGGYFDNDGKPLGLRVGRQLKTSNLRRANWGVFWIKNGVARIRHTRDFPAGARADEAIQCGPRLVVDGHPTDLKPQWSRRSGLGIDRRGRVVLAIADGPLSLDDWAQVFASNDGLGCRDALNLDGGPSTQLAYKTPARRGEVPGGWPVPDALIIR